MPPLYSLLCVVVLSLLPELRLISAAWTQRRRGEVKLKLILMINWCRIIKQSSFFSCSFHQDVLFTTVCIWRKLFPLELIYWKHWKAQFTHINNQLLKHSWLISSIITHRRTTHILKPILETCYHLLIKMDKWWRKLMGNIVCIHMFLQTTYQEFTWWSAKIKHLMHFVWGVFVFRKSTEVVLTSADQSHWIIDASPVQQPADW